MRTPVSLLCFIFTLSLAGATTSAQETPGTPEVQAAAPANRIARLSWFRGDFQVQRADNTAASDGSDSAVINMPLTQGTRLVTAEGGEAEIEFEDGSVVRLTPKSALSLDMLATGGKTASTQLTLLGGLAYFELRHAASATYTVTAGTMVVSPADNAIFRVSLDEQPALVAVLAGTLSVSAVMEPDDTEHAGFSASVKAGESLHPDPADPTRYFLNPQLAGNNWDAWNQSRDTEAAVRTAARDGYADSQGYGWSDLDQNGTWYNVTNADGSSSELWQPAIAADAGSDEVQGADAFDPYGDGAFVYSGGGYVWASGFSWGWLPYRCGRWNWYPGFGWAWSPNRFCGVYGYGGWSGINVGRHPRQYRILHFPPISPVHPILRVHTSDPRPVVQHNDNKIPIQIAGSTAVTLPLLPAAGAASGGLLSGSLYRDYPVEAATQRPILGTVAPAVTEPRTVAGWVAPLPGSNGPRTVVRAPGGESYVRPAVPYRAPAPPPAPRAAPAPAAASSKPK